MIMNQSELNSLVDSLKYGHGNIISKNDSYVLTKPLSTWDTNYRLYDLQEEVTYLVDCDDVQASIEDVEEYGGILYQDLVKLNVDLIKDVAWKTEKDEFY